jgi:hypothetical protein
MEAERQLAWFRTRDLELFYFLDGIHHRHVCAAIVLSNSSVLLGWLYRAVIFTPPARATDEINKDAATTVGLNTPIAIPPFEKTGSARQELPSELD